MTTEAILLVKKCFSKNLDINQWLIATVLKQKEGFCFKQNPADWSSLTSKHFSMIKNKCLNI